VVASHSMGEDSVRRSLLSVRIEGGLKVKRKVLLRVFY